MKTLLFFGILFTLAIQSGLAQEARYYDLFDLTDGTGIDYTATLPAASTNELFLFSNTVTNQIGSPNSTAYAGNNITSKCSEFDKCGFTFQATGITGTTNGVYGVLIYASMSKGVVYDQNPRWNFTTTNAAPGGQTFTVVTNLDLTGIDTLSFSFINGCANGYLTNVIAGINLKSPKYGSKLSDD